MAQILCLAGLDSCHYRLCRLLGTCFYRGTLDLEGIMSQLYQCLDCDWVGELNQHGRCASCQSDAVTTKIYYPAPEIWERMMDRLIDRVEEISKR